MSKQYTPQEVALAVLNRCKELTEASKLAKKEHKDEKQDKELCEDIAEKEVDEHEDEMHKVKKSSHKLKEFVKKKKKTDLKKFGGGSHTSGMGGGSLPGSTATTGGPSIASQIGFGKKEVKKARVDEGKSNAEKRQDREARNDRMIGSDSGEAFGTPKQPSKSAAKKVIPKLPKDVNKNAIPAQKAVGLKPLTSDKVQAPNSDELPAKPKAATTLKNFMSKRCK
jgi:hypothetical protein